MCERLGRVVLGGGAGLGASDRKGLASDCQRTPSPAMTGREFAGQRR